MIISANSGKNKEPRNRPGVPADLERKRRKTEITPIAIETRIIPREDRDITRTSIRMIGGDNMHTLSRKRKLDEYLNDEDD